MFLFPLVYRPSPHHHQIEELSSEINQIINFLPFVQTTYSSGLYLWFCGASIVYPRPATMEMSIYSSRQTERVRN